MFWKRARPVAAAQSNGQCSLPDAHPHHLVGKRVRLIEVQPSELFPLGETKRPNGKTFETVVLARSDGPIPNIARCSVTPSFAELPV
jgi:hypothetical protein